jgi:hypothetical protein
VIPFRTNQMVCRVSYRDGIPFVEVRAVVRVTSSTYYVAGDKKPSRHWFATWREAIEGEYRLLFGMWDHLFGIRLRPNGWTMDDSVQCICKVRRLEKRLMQRGKSRT